MNVHASSAIAPLYRAGPGEYCRAGQHRTVLHLVLAAALTAAAPSPGATDAVRIIRSTNPRTRYVRVRYDIFISGVHGTETAVFDLATGRGVERVAAGPLSYAGGFDGKQSWTADSTGMPLVDDTPDARLDRLAWAHFFGRRGPERPTVRRLGARGETLTLRLQYSTLSGPIDVTLNRATKRVSRIEDSTGIDPSVSQLSDYRRVGDIVLPFEVVGASRYGTSREHVRSVAFPDVVSAAEFAPPRPPDDTVLDGITTVPMLFAGGAPVVPIRINGGPVIRVLFDTGASNAVTRRTARRLGLVPVGRDLSGGMGAGVVPQQYTTVKRMQIGAAVMTNQPFTVLDDTIGGLDGIIGCEVLQRLAARFDFIGRRVDLVRDVAMFLIASPAIPMRLSGCTPEIDGALDGLRGAIAIDTGSDDFFDVMTPSVRKHRLLARYHVSRRLTTGEGLGGKTIGYAAFARRLQLGNRTIAHVPINLSAMTSGALNDPTELGNAGVSSFGFYTTVFDYRSRRMWLLR